MRRTVLSTSLLVAFGIAAVGAQKCTPTGPAARTFAAGSLVIPMDNCHQWRDGSKPPGCVGGSAAADDGVLRAYGLVYFLLKNGVTVYWAIDGATPKASVTAPDVTVPAHAPAAAQRMAWVDGSFADLADTAGGVSYIGGPFLVSAEDTSRVVKMLTDASDPSHADFARFQAEAKVDVHRLQADAGVPVSQVRPLVGPPPKLSILNVNPSNKKTSSNVMYRYAVAAGLSWPCKGDGDCAGGVTGNGVHPAGGPGKGCDIAGILAYMKSGGPSGNQDASIPQACDASGLCAPNFNKGPGLVYDILCDDDFIPPTTVTPAGGVARAGTTADTALATGGYKLLWIPHWDTNGVTPTDPAKPPALPAVSLADQLSWQLQGVAWFVNQGSNLFVECLGIQDLEGIAGETSTGGPNYGLAATRFQSTSGLRSYNGSGTLQPFLDPAHPSLQIGDFAYSLVSGAITTYYPDRAASPASAYRDNAKRLIWEKPSDTTPWDISSTIQVLGNDTVPRGNVAYLGGHDYSPDPASGSGGQTAGTRIVLNTLFNLGFGCADPGTACNTGGFGACATGVLKCASGGGYQCVGAQPAAKDLCHGQDDNCNGVIDDDCNPPACNPGDTRTCYTGPAGTQDVGACKHGTQTCTGGFWGPCAGEVLPTPEVCNGVDDDCSGAADDGTLCSAGYACTGGACLPSSCNSENARCPTGFTCDASTHACLPIPCGSGGTPCGSGRICQAGACVDPCQGVSCGQGSSCSGGQCVAGGCSIPGCPTAGQVCLDGSCVADPCASAACPTGTFCRAGDCVRSCAVVECAKGQACDADGFCETPCSPACGTGQRCVLGACQVDACAGVTCGAGQVCSNGACVDPPCNHIACPAGACQDGQCYLTGSTNALTRSAGALVTSASGGGSDGCGTGGAGGLASLAFLAALLVRRRGWSPALAPVAGRGALLALVLLGAAASGCGSKGGSAAQAVTCTDGKSACGATCVDLSSSLASCGACGRACASGYTCAGGGCSLDTGNPYLQAISPTSAGRDQTRLALRGTGFAAGAKVRLSGGGMPTTVLSPDPASLTSTSLALSGMDLSAALVGGTVQVRVLNPNPSAGGGPLVSNDGRLAVTDTLLLRGVSPQASARQDAAPLDLDLVGVGFASGLTASLAGPAGSAARVTKALTTAFVDAGRAHVTGLDPSALAVGAYDLTVTNPGGATSAALAFTVTEGAPALALTQTCASQAQTDFTVSGTNLYPSSVAHVAGGAITDSVLETTCLTGTDAVGRCQNGQVRVSVDLSTTPAQTYSFWIVNPGSPAPLASVHQDIQVVTGTCP